jgi:hypothetical protein
MSQDVLDPDPFTKPILATKGDSNSQDTYAAVGAALSSWETSGTMFGALYGAFVKPTGANTIALRAYGAILAPSSRHDMITEAAEAYFAGVGDAALHERVKKLLKLYRSASARRNEIAHGVVMGRGKPLKFFLVPGIFASRKRELDMVTTKYQLSSVEINQYTRHFAQLTSRAVPLLNDVRLQYETLPPKLKERFG